MKKYWGGICGDWHLNFSSSAFLRPSVLQTDRERERENGNDRLSFFGLRQNDSLQDVQVLTEDIEHLSALSQLASIGPFIMQQT
jgi:hypothetical protein